MFVLQSKYNAEVMDKTRITLQLIELTQKWNDLIDLINEKGGQAFLDGDTNKEELTKEDLNKLISLCHPDKHNGKASATLMTKKLLKLREQI